MQTVVGIDIGGTTVKLAIVREHATGPGAHEILKSASLDTLPDQPGEQTVARIGDRVRALMTEAGVGRLDGVGVGCPGLIDNLAGVVVASANLPNFNNLPLGPLLQTNLGIPTKIHNDAKAAMLGEFHFGSNKGCQNMVILTLGTGVGGGVIAGGKLITGADNAATELGHVKVEYSDGAPCGCGKRGCLEAYAGINGIARIAASFLADGANTLLKTDKPSTRQINEAAVAGDEIAKLILYTVGRYLGRGIANFAEIFNPEKVVLAGGASRATPFLLPGIRESMLEFCSYHLTRDRTHVVATEMPDDINVLGAAAVFLEG